MILEYIKSWIYENEFRKQVLYNSKQNGLVGVMFDFANNNNESDQILKILNNAGVTSEKIIFLSYYDAKEPVTSTIPTYTKDQLHWTGFPKSEEIEKFYKNQFTAFYYLSSDFEKHQKFIVSKIKSEFKAGVYSKGIETYLDLTIDSKSKSPSEYLKEILQLITKLKENKNAK